MIERARRRLVAFSALALPLFTLVEVNYPQLSPQSELAIFAMFGIALAYLEGGARVKNEIPPKRRFVLALLFIAVSGYVVIQTEPLFSRWWLGGVSLGQRAGSEQFLDFAIGALGLLLILEATRRSLGPALPILAVIFIAYAAFGAHLPGWLLPHRGYGLERIIGQTFLQSQGVYGIALRVMFSYVFLFVVFGAVLEATGAIDFLISACQRVFRGSPGGPAKIAVVSSGLMGSLSGSAVANTATTGTFTIPLMRSAGFPPHIAGAIEAAASTGGALVPPVMGAGAYMMLEIISPPVTYLQVIRAALIPALLYYFSLLLMVHLTAKRLAVTDVDPSAYDKKRATAWAGVVFAGSLVTLLVILLLGYSVFRAVSVALILSLVLAAFHDETRVGPRRLLKALTRASLGGVALACAAASVGIIIGVVTLTGIGTKVPSLIISYSEHSLLAALALIMVSSLILGMGLPSAVCYLLMATLIGPVLGDLGVLPIAAHLFIFYFGMMSMVTPPVALAAYAASSIAKASLYATTFAAFRFALVGFTLPYLFVFRPELLMLDATGATAAPLAIIAATALAVVGIIPLAASISGYLLAPLGFAARGVLLIAAGCALVPGTAVTGPLSKLNIAGVAILAVVGLTQAITRE